MIPPQVASSSPAEHPLALRGELVHDGRRHRVLFPVHAAGKLWRLPRFGALLDAVLGWLLKKRRRMKLRQVNALQGGQLVR